MARDILRLPNLQELNKPQLNAYNLPLEGQHLIVGGPGTGKSVVALLRARRLAKDKKNYLFLVYNVLLEKSCYALGGTELRAITWKKWFKDNFKTWFGHVMPTKKNTDGDGYSEDWKSIENLEPLRGTDTSLYLVIDEGQDMPPEFYQTLIKIGFKNFYVVADQNQRITEHHSSVHDIRKALVLEVKEICELTSNFRNSLPIARLSQEFFTNDPASAPISLPKPRPGDIVPRIVRYGDNSEVDLTRIAKEILTLYDRNIDKLICIITPNDAIRNKFCEILHSIAQSQPSDFDHDTPNIQTYFSNQIITSIGEHEKLAEEKCSMCGAQMRLRRNSQDDSLFWGCRGYPACCHTKPYVNINFKDGGVAVINQQSIKGLEFDTVYIADIDLFYGNDTDGLKKKFYVMTSRPRDDLTLLRTGGSTPRVDEIIPGDETILKKG